jgi:ATP synthase protein I
VRDLPPPRRSESEDTLADTVGRKEGRRARAPRDGRHGLAFGLGMFGLVGWSVAVPTLLGIALGVWIDTRTAGPYSWTLMLMIGGLIVGCFNAWYWLRRELDGD